jgi:hypothetical protein
MHDYSELLVLSVVFRALRLKNEPDLLGNPWGSSFFLQEEL